MSLKWRARLTWAAGMSVFVAGVFLVGPQRLDHAPWLVALVALPLVIMIAAQLLGFRCPHCGARAVRGQYGYWLVSDECQKCFRDFEGPFLSEDEVAEKLVTEKNPELARQMRRERLEEEDLRRRAPTNPQAATVLERMLEDRLYGVQSWVHEMRRLYDSGQAPRSDLEAAEASLKKLNEDLASCRSLNRGRSERSRLTGA